MVDWDRGVSLDGRLATLRQAVSLVQKRSPGEYSPVPIFCEGEPDGFTLAQIDAMVVPERS